MNVRDVPAKASAYLPPAGHHFVLQGRALRITIAGTPPLLVITGDVNEITYPGMVDILSRASENPGPIQVNLAGVEDCDLAGLRAIVGLTGTSGHDHTGPRSVVLHGMPPHLTAVMRILGWDSTPGLTLHEPSRPD